MEQSATGLPCGVWDATTQQFCDRPPERIPWTLCTAHRNRTSRWSTDRRCGLVALTPPENADVYRPSYPRDKVLLVEDGKWKRDRRYAVLDEKKRAVAQRGPKRLRRRIKREDDG